MLMFCHVVRVICHTPKYPPKLFPFVLLLLLFLCLLVVSFVVLHMVCEVLPLLPSPYRWCIGGLSC